jgi:hypothetical protein
MSRSAATESSTANIACRLLRRLRSPAGACSSPRPLATAGPLPSLGVPPPGERLCRGDRGCRAGERPGLVALPLGSGLARLAAILAESCGRSSSSLKVRSTTSEAIEERGSTQIVAPIIMRQSKGSFSAQSLPLQNKVRIQAAGGMENGPLFMFG